MKNPIRLFSIAFVFAVVSCGSDKKTDPASSEFKGKVKSVKSTTYEVEPKLGEISRGEVTYGENFLQKFDEGGDATETLTYSLTGEVSRRYVYKFNDEHRIVERLVYDEEGTLTKSVFEWGKDELKLETSYNEAGEVAGKIVYEVDGKWTKQIWYDAEGEVENTISSLLRGKKLVQYNSKFPGATSETQVFLSYDKSGNVVEIKEVRDDEVTLTTYTYKLDETGNWIERIDYTGEEKQPERMTVREIEYYKE